MIVLASDTSPNAQPDRPSGSRRVAAAEWQPPSGSRRVAATVPATCEMGILAKVSSRPIRWSLMNVPLPPRTR